MRYRTVRGPTFCAVNLSFMIMGVQDAFIGVDDNSTKLWTKSLY